MQLHMPGGKHGELQARIHHFGNGFVCTFLLVLFSTKVFAFNLDQLKQAHWTFCAKQNTVCYFEGTRIVRYGVEPNWYYGVFTKQVNCSTPEFGDPIQSKNKQCEFSDSTTSAKLEQPTLSVLPIFYVMSDVKAASKPSKADVVLLQKQLLLTKNLYESILKVPIDNITSHKPLVIHGKYSSTDFANYSDQSGIENLVTKELLDFTKTDRNHAPYIYLVLVARPQDTYFGPRGLGGGRTLNGGINQGGGIIFMEYAALNQDQPYPFQSTLAHELGHALGLTHTDCLKYSMNTGTSIMSYNPKHHSSHLTIAPDPGTFTPEEIFNLANNYQFFPQLHYGIDVYRKDGVRDLNNCSLAPMSQQIGQIQVSKLPVVRNLGYDLYWNGQVVSGPDALLYNFRDALQNCKWNKEQHPEITVRCKFQGEEFTTGQ